MGSVRANAHARRHAEIIGLVGLAHGTSHFYHLMLPALFPWLMHDFSLTYTQVGLLTTTFFVISGVGQALAGFAVDRTGAERILFVGIGTLALSGMVLSVSNGYPMLILTAAIASAGNRVFHLGREEEETRCLPDIASGGAFLQHTPPYAARTLSPPRRNRRCVWARPTANRVEQGLLRLGGNEILRYHAYLCRRSSPPAWTKRPSTKWTA